MREEVFITYMIALQYKYGFNELMTLRYSPEANDRVRYEMLILTICHKIRSMDTNKALSLPSDFSEFIENYMPLNEEQAKEKFIRLITK